MELESKEVPREEAEDPKSVPHPSCQGFRDKSSCSEPSQGLIMVGNPCSFLSGAKPVTVSRTANAEESGDERGKLLAALDV